MQKLIIIGENSYLPSGLRNSLQGKNVALESFTYDTWKKNFDKIKQANIIINFAIAPEFSTKSLKEDEIIDIQLANVIKDSNCHFIFLSSR